MTDANNDFGVALRVRRTVMDGEVHMFATKFHEVVQPKRGVRYDAAGPFYVSASRNQIVVHNCELSTAEDYELFLAAMVLARGAFDELRRKEIA